MGKFVPLIPSRNEKLPELALVHARVRAYQSAGKERSFDKSKEKSRVKGAVKAEEHAQISWGVKLGNGTWN